MIFLLVSLASAVDQNIESAATTRIVGESAPQLKEQLRDDSLMNMEKALFDGSPGIDNSKVHAILGDIFEPTSVIIAQIFNLESDLANEDILFVIDPYTKDSSMIEAGIVNMYYAEKITDELEDNNDLIVINSPYAGLYIPEEESLTATLSPRASLVAPMSYSSDGFTRAFVCNIGKYNEVGETYRQARNNYYWNTRDRNELIGLTLISFSLYGSPFKNIEVPAISDSYYCRDYQDNFQVESNPMFGISSAEPQSETPTYTKEFQFDIEDYNILEQGNFSLIETDKTNNLVLPYELVLPSRTLIEEFPSNTIVTDFGVTSMSNSVDLNVEDLPMFDGFGNVERECYEDNKSAGVTFENSYTEESRLVITNIYPVEVLNCTNGEFRLYQDIEYYMEYVPYSPVFIKSVSSPILTPGQTINLSVEIENLQAAPVSGFLTVQEDDYIFNGKNITADTGVYKIELTAPETQGLYTYRVDFYYENESVTYKEFNLNVNALELELFVDGDTIDEANIIVAINSNLNESIDADVEYNLESSEGIEDNGEDSISVEPGMNLYDLSFEGLDRTKILYDVVVGVSYLTSYEVDSVGIIVEHAPTIVQPNIVISENESLTLTPDVYDVDGDEVSISVESLFENNSLIDFDSSGTYNINLTADDGIKQTIKTIALTIENTNRLPILDDMEKIIAKEGEEFTFNPTYSDPDNENAVENDDNNLSLSFSGVLNSTGTQTMDYDSSGNYNVTVYLSDGEYSVSKEVELEVENTNRQPEIITEINASENSIINISDYAFDPDNNNSVFNDDNNLTFITSDYFDEDGIWEISYEDAGVYEVNATVSDGEYNVSETITINISNVNRAPLISTNELTTQYIADEKNVLLSVLADDLDIEDNVSVSWYVDGNQTSNGTSFLFDSDGETGTFEVTAIASDGDLTNETSFEVIVSDVPIFNGLDGDTSQLNASQLSTVDFFTLEKSGKVKIVFQKVVDLSETVDFVTTIDLDNSYASLDYSRLKALEGISAKITFYNVDIIGNPIIYYDEGFSLEPTKICPSSICSDIIYNASAKTLKFDVAHFSTYGVQGGDGNQFDLDADNITIEDPLTGEIQETFIIENNGLGDLDNLQVTGSFNSGFDFNVSPSSLILLSGDSATLTISGTMMNLYTDETVEAGTIHFQDNDFERDITVYISPTDPIKIIGLDIDIGSESYNNLDDGDKIEIFPGEEMEISMEIKNLYKTETNAEVKVDFEVGEFDDEERLTFRLDNNEDDKKETKITIPLELTKDEYDLDIRLRAEIEDELDFELEWEITLEYDENNENKISVKSSSNSQPKVINLKENIISQNIPLTGKTVSKSFAKQLEDLGAEFIIIVFLLLFISIIIILIAYLLRN